MKTNITKLSLSNAISYDNTNILEYEINYPHITLFPHNPCEQKINQYYREVAMDYLSYIQTVLKPAAIEDYNYRTEHSYPILEYEADLNYTITYNENGILSLFMDKYQYTGGAHGNTTRSSDTWVLGNCTQIPLAALFPNDPNYIQHIENDIIAQIDAQVAAGADYYFDDYAQLVRENFDPQSYYVIPANLVFYFQQYEIAPYSSGILEFKIPYFRA